MKKALFILMAAIICVIAASAVFSENDSGYPYDNQYFEASERVVFLSPSEASINVIPKQGKIIDVRCVPGDDDVTIESGLGALSKDYYGVSDSFEIPVQLFGRSTFSYRIEYKGSDETVWKSTPKRIVKTPFRRLAGKDSFKFIIVTDDHLSDDADSDDGGQKITDPALRALRLSADSVNFFWGKFPQNQFYNPNMDSQRELILLMNAFCFSKNTYQINNENPDLVLNLGDTGVGFEYKWPGLGLKDQNIATSEDVEQYEKIFRLGERKMFSGLSPNIPIYWVMGNHDQESGFIRTKNPATEYRKKYFKQPSLDGSADENYYYVAWGSAGTEFVPITSDTTPRKGNVLIIVLDVMRYNNDLPRKPEDWTLGPEQKDWFKRVVKYDADWKFVCFHHVLGGWPSGSDEQILSYAYGRGPLFTREDYKDITQNPDAVEQVELTKLMLDNGVDIVLYGHDHIFHTKEIGINSKSRKMYGICVGSTKDVAETDWYGGQYWMKYYGIYGHDFLGPSGYTKLTITKDATTVNYVQIER